MGSLTLGGGGLELGLGRILGRSRSGASGHLAGGCGSGGALPVRDPGVEGWGAYPAGVVRRPWRGADQVKRAPGRWRWADDVEPAAGR